jgi:hypothetical protein
VLLVHELEEVLGLLVDVRVEEDLVDDGDMLGFVQQDLEIVDLEVAIYGCMFGRRQSPYGRDGDGMRWERNVRDADRLDETSFLERLHLGPGLVDTTLDERGGVDQVEVEVLYPDLCETGLAGFGDGHLLLAHPEARPLGSDPSAVV